MEKRVSTNLKRPSRPSSGIIASKIQQSVSSNPWQTSYGSAIGVNKPITRQDPGRKFYNELENKKLSSVNQMVINGPVISKLSSRDIPMTKTNSNEINLFKNITKVTNIPSGNPHEMKVNCLKTTNLIGQREEYLDPKDNNNLPPYSRLVIANKDNFLQSNLKMLISTNNEYYPFLGGECLCSKCSCGNCKCVHFKYRVGENTLTGISGRPMSSCYRDDYKAHPIEGVECRIAFPELVTFPTRCRATSAYKRDYQPPVIPYEMDGDNIGMKSAKNVNLGPTAVNVRCPFSKETQSKLDYPDWKCSKVKPIEPFKPETVVKNMPFTCKRANNEYGKFYEEEGTPGVERAPNKAFQKTSIPIDTTIPTNYASTNQAAYPCYGEDQTDPLKRFYPRNNLKCENTPPSDGHYQKSSQAYDVHPDSMKCILRERINKLKQNLRDFALTNRISY